MKRRALIIFISFAIFLSTSCYMTPRNDIPVYKTSAGAKYHKENCRYVKGKEIEINLSRALYDGLEPCKVCNPPTKKDLDELNQ